jgi:hypothetical protein
MPFKTSNVSLSLLRKILIHVGCKQLGINSGHQKFTRSDLRRPIIIQTHVDPVPEFIVLQIMRTLSLKRADMKKIVNEI